MLEIGGKPLEGIHRGKDGGAAALRKVSEAREKFIFLGNRYVTFGCNDEQDVKAACSKTRQAVDAGIFVSGFELFINGDGNAEQLCDLLLCIAKAFSFVSEAFTDFLTLFGGGRCHD